MAEKKKAVRNKIVFVIEYKVDPVDGFDLNSALEKLREDGEVAIVDTRLEPEDA